MISRQRGEKQREWRRKTTRKSLPATLKKIRASRKFWVGPASHCLALTHRLTHQNLLTQMHTPLLIQLPKVRIA